MTSDRPTMRECPNAKCKALNSLIASVCAICGSTMAVRASGSFDLFANMVVESRKLIHSVALPNAEEERMLREVHELETWYANAADKPGAERNAIERRAVKLATDLMRYVLPA